MISTGDTYHKIALYEKTSGISGLKTVSAFDVKDQVTFQESSIQAPRRRADTRVTQEQLP